MLTRDEFQLLYEQGPEAVWSAFVDLRSAATAQQAQIQTLQEQIQMLPAHIKELENRLNKEALSKMVRR